MLFFKHNKSEEYNFGIKFQKELSNGSLIFLIVDDEYHPSGGHVVVSPSGIPKVIIDDFYDIDSNERTYLESLAKSFFEATRA